MRYLAARLEPFLKPRIAPSPTQARRALVPIYLLSFGAHSLVGMGFCVLLRIYAPNPAPMASVLGWLLLALSVMQLPIALLVGYAGSYRQSRQGIIALTILLALLLANSVWLTGFAWLVGAQISWLMGFAAIVMVYYALGVMLVYAFARWASAIKQDASMQRNSATPKDAAL